MSENPSFHVGFVVVRPDRTREKGLKILDLLTSQGGIYVPEETEVWKEKENFETKKYSPEIVETLLAEWQGRHGPLPGLKLERWKPYQTSLIASQNDFAPSDFVAFFVERAYLVQSGKLSEFLAFAKKFYSLLSPVFGDIGSPEMKRRVRRGAVEFIPGMDLFKQGLPEFEWAVFLGPEYADLFGREKLLSAPCYRTESLSDGGVLLLITESPFDFDKDPGAFNQKRDLIRAYLGLDAFYMGDEHRATRYPTFRFWKERQALIKEYRGKERTLRPLTPHELRDQEDWIANVQRTSDSFRTKTQSQGYTLDYSETSIGRLEEYLSSTIVKDESAWKFERDVGAYLGLTIQKLFGGKWAIDHFYRTPALDLPKAGVSLQQEKRVSEGEMKLSFEPSMGDTPDAIAFERTVRTWPVSRIHRFISSGAQKGLLGYYVDAVRKALETKETGMIRIQT